MAINKIVIAGYYGFSNLGDEAILAVLIYHLKKNFPQSELIVLSGNPALTAQQYHVKSISRWNLWQIRQAIKESVAFVLGGGGLLQDKTSQRSLFYYLGLLRWAQTYRKPIYLIGQGIGPLARQSSKRLVNSVLSNAHCILVRDPESYLELCNLGLSEEKLLQGEDLALLAPQLFPSVHQSKRQKRHILIAPRPGLTLPALESLVLSLDTIAQENEINIMIAPFFRKTDLSSAHALAKALKTPVRITVAMENIPGTMINFLAQSTFVVAMRLHSLILALAVGVPFMAISYDQKMNRFVRKVEMAMASGVKLPLWNVDEFNSESIRINLGELIECANSSKNHFDNAKQILVTTAEHSLTQVIGLMREELQLG